MYDACQSKEVYKRKQTAKKYERTDEFLRLKTPDEVLTDVLHAIAKFDDSEKLTAFAKRHFNLDDKSAAKFAGLKFKEPGYCSLSLKAMNKIFNTTKKPMAVRCAGPNSSKAGPFQSLYEKNWDKSITLYSLKPLYSR